MFELALFPLHTVLFPEGRLEVRIFEKRYMDMISACMKKTQPFGVCLIRSGHEVGEAAEPHTVGTTGHIVEWDMRQAGILQVSVCGGRRFRIERTRVREDQLIMGEVEYLPEEKTEALPPAHRDLRELLVKILEQTGEQTYTPPVKLDDAIWVAYRLTELLPLPGAVKQEVLEQPDAVPKLDLLAAAVAAAREDGM